MALSPGQPSSVAGPTPYKPSQPLFSSGIEGLDVRTHILSPSSPLASPAARLGRTAPYQPSPPPFSSGIQGLAVITHISVPLPLASQAWQDCPRNSLLQISSAQYSGLSCNNPHQCPRPLASLAARCGRTAPILAFSTPLQLRYTGLSFNNPHQCPPPLSSPA